MLQEFRNFDVNRKTTDELVALAAFGRHLRDEYDHQQLDEPDWLDVQLKSLRREIRAKNADKLEARKKEIELRLEGMKSPTQKKAELIKEQAKITKMLEEIGA